jgi:hypothetical protein
MIALEEPKEIIRLIWFSLGKEQLGFGGRSRYMRESQPQTKAELPPREHASALVIEL